MEVAWIRINIFQKFEVSVDKCNKLEFLKGWWGSSEIFWYTLLTLGFNTPENIYWSCNFGSFHLIKYISKYKYSSLLDVVPKHLEHPIKSFKSPLWHLTFIHPSSFYEWLSLGIGWQTKLIYFFNFGQTVFGYFTSWGLLNN